VGNAGKIDGDRVGRTLGDFAELGFDFLRAALVDLSLEGDKHGAVFLSDADVHGVFERLD